MGRMTDAAEPLVALSITHLTPLTASLIQSGDIDVSCYPNEYGSFLYVGENTSAQADLDAVLKRARELGYVWIKFDADAAEVDELEIYPWE